MMTRLAFKTLIVILLLAPMMLVATASAAAPAEAPHYNVIHTVRAGETLFSIARLYGVSPYAIARANYLMNPNLLWAGQRLVIPSYGPPSYPQWDYQAPGTVYIVRPGDTLFSIAVRFGTSVQVITAANNIANPNVLFAGQRLVIPTGAVVVPKPVIVKKVVVVEKAPPPPPLKPAVCNELTRITFPREGEVLDGVGTHSVLGTAAIDHFQFYKLELGLSHTPINFFSITDDVFTKPIVNGILFTGWNTGALPAGKYTLRLTVVDNSGQFPAPCDVHITIDHTQNKSLQLLDP